jgi:hypothetical protein
MSRLDYVRYDGQAQSTQEVGKNLACRIEAFIEQCIQCPRSKALALTKLEECYMWIGKGVRNDQIKRNGSAPLREKRG